MAEELDGEEEAGWFSEQEGENEADMMIVNAATKYSSRSLNSRPPKYYNFV